MADLLIHSRLRHLRSYGSRAVIGLAAIVGVTFASPWLAKAKAQSRALKPLPDTEITRSGAFKAWLIEPTTRYDHAVLGDGLEAGGFAVERAGKRLMFTLPPDAVFEDRRVRLADLDGDGTPEVIVVKSYLDRGSAIAIYRILRDRIEPIAESAPVGTRNRWLNPVGIADFVGNGEMSIAAVITPHLAGSLRIYRLKGASVEEVARIDGYTSHILGSRDLDLGRVIRASRGGPPLIVLPTLDRRALAMISFQGAKPRLIRQWPAKAPIDRLQIDKNSRAKLVTTSGNEWIDLKE